MEQSEVESTLDKPDEVPTESNQDSTILGKFASVDELAKAYEQLESAFTKKSQELARITAENKDKVCVTKIEPVKEIPQVISGHSSNFAFTNVSEARTLHATTKVAENFFKQKGERI